MNSSRHRHLALFAIVPLMVTAACAGSSASTTTPTTTFAVTTTVPPTTPTTAVIEPPYVEGTLTVWADPALADAVRSRGAAFAAATGIDVVVVAVAEPEILPAVLEGSQPRPDVFIGPHTWLYELAVAGLTEPVTLGDSLPGGVVAAVSLRTYPLAVPVSVDALVQFRNPTLAAARPTAAESIGCQGCLVFPADGDLDVTYPFLASGGGYLFGPDPDSGYDVTDTAVDSTEAVASAAVLESLVAEGSISTAPDRDGVLAAFVAGTAGIIWAGPEAIGAIPGEAVESLPTIGDAAAVSSLRVLVAYVNAKGALKAEATRFAEGYLGDAAGSRAIADSNGSAPVWTAAATADELVVLAAADTGTPVPYAPQTPAAWDLVSAAFAAILTGTPAETALVDAADAIRFGTETAPG